MADRKILIWDIEWKPTKAYVWNAWGVNIYPQQVIEHGGLLCFGYKWLGEKNAHVITEWEHGHQGMVEQAHAVMAEADAYVTYNGDRFDIPKMNGEFLLAGLAPLAPTTSIDVIKTVKKLGFFMNRLGFIGPFVGIGGKVEHEGMALWTKVENGDENAQGRMKKYCAQDVKLTEKLYKKVLPFIRNHPHLSPKEACGACGAKSTQKRGFRYTKSFEIQRLQCTSCGSWSDGTRKKI
jgi:hypothetical protein